VGPLAAETESALLAAPVPLPPHPTNAIFVISELCPWTTGRATPANALPVANFPEFDRKFLLDIVD
jgi:hypothetical protein